MTKVLRTFEKDPDDKEQYGIDWQSTTAPGPFLETGETIDTSTWVVPTGITEVSSTNDYTTASIVVSGGTAGQRYVLTNRITTTGGSLEGRIKDRSIEIVVRER